MLAGIGWYIVGTIEKPGWVKTMDLVVAAFLSVAGLIFLMRAVS